MMRAASKKLSFRAETIFRGGLWLSFEKRRHLNKPQKLSFQEKLPKNYSWADVVAQPLGFRSSNLEVKGLNPPRRWISFLQVPFLLFLDLTLSVLNQVPQRDTSLLVI